MNLQNEKLVSQLNSTRIPRHVGLILDGNGRWAQAQGKPRMMGHRAGMEKIRSAVRFAHDAGIEVLSVYAFSTENWKRSQEEVAGLMRLLIEYMKLELDHLHQENVCIRFMGDEKALPAAVYKALQTSREKTKNNTGLIFNIGLNYGGQQEIAHACRLIAQKVADGDLTTEEIDVSVVQNHLYTTDLPEVDLLIRTSGEQRISNFMLYQIAYAELVFVDCFWPDFDEQAFLDSLLKYQQRERRFGGV